MGGPTLPHDAHEDEQEYHAQRHAVTEPPAVTSVAAAAAAPEGRSARTQAAASSLPTRRHGSQATALAMAASSAAAVAAFIVLRRWRRRRRSGGPAAVQLAAVSKEQVFCAVLGLREPSVALPPPSAAASALAGRSLVLSDRLDVQSLETRFGLDAWKEGRQPAEHTYWPVDVLVAAGAAACATVLSEPLGLG